MSLRGHVAFISGAGRNIGRAIALELAAEGADVVLNTRRSKEEIERVAAEVRELGVRALPLLGDVGLSSDIEILAERALAEFGKVDILVNNAAIRPEKPFLELTENDWRSVLAVDMDAAFYTCQAFLPGMIAQKWGRIINLGGVHAMHGHPHRVHVSAAKNGVWGLTKSIALEFAAQGVTANVVAPGVIDTQRDDPNRQQRFESVAAKIPVGRMGTVEEIASICGYLASDRAAFLTGQIIGVNGGQDTSP
ncbi:MAG TPA: 3-oxoacyl-ACP reductase family protein [Dehalococcoidia bacterium]|nr:3-oxoacyl-ACP reductase family protein [Dehalococcoidia bacterium]